MTKIEYVIGWREDGSGMVGSSAAVCDACGEPAATFATAHKNVVGHRDGFDITISRRTQVIVYACDEHYHAVSDSLCDEFGYTINRVEPDTLAEAVAREDRERFERKRKSIP